MFINHTMHIKNIIILLLLITTCKAVHSQFAKVYFTSREITRVAINTNYYYQLKAQDSVGNKISYSVNKLPSWLKYNVNGHSIFGKGLKAGQFPIDIIASTNLDTSHQQFMLTVYNKQTRNILCLGNSITNGVDTFNSYRRDLWQMLHTGNYTF